MPFARKIRKRGLRPSCGASLGTRGRAVAMIDHPAGEECQSVLAGVVGQAVGVSGVRAGGCPVAFGQVPGVGEFIPGPGSSGIHIGVLGRVHASEGVVDEGEGDER